MAGVKCFFDAEKKEMIAGSQFGVACVLLVASEMAAMGQMAPTDLRARLESEFKDKVLQIRGFPQNKEVIITAGGRTITDIEPGLWTLGLMEVKSVEVKSNEIVFEGNRAGLVYKSSVKKLGPIRLKDRFTVRVIETKLIQGDLASADWRKVFVLDPNEIPGLVPEYWARFLREEPISTLTAVPGAASKSIHRVGPGISAPKPLQTNDPDYPKHWFSRTIRGVVVLRTVVDENGQVTDIEVQRPLGLGFDEEAIKAVKKWRFRPAMKDKKPVPVAINIEVNFNHY